MKRKCKQGWSRISIKLTAISTKLMAISTKLMAISTKLTAISTKLTSISTKLTASPHLFIITNVYLCYNNYITSVFN